jgi:hypothetical protein
MLITKAKKSKCNNSIVSSESYLDLQLVVLIIPTEPGELLYNILSFAALSNAPLKDSKH